MFVEDVVALPAPMPAARDRLLELRLDGGMQRAAAAAFVVGAAVLLRAGFAGLAGQVAVRSVPAYRRGSTIVIPIRWVLTGSPYDREPPLDAALELEPTPAGTCRLAFRGSYRPPVGRLGADLDWVLLQSAARETVREFLARIGSAVLEQRVADGSSKSAGADISAGTSSTANADVAADVLGTVSPAELDLGSLLEMLNAAARYSVRSIGDVRWASVTAWFVGAPCTVAHTDSRVLALDESQYPDGDGPCLRAIHIDAVVTGTVDGVRSRWPRWAGAADRAGVRSFLAVPLHAGSKPVGSLNLFSARSDGLRNPQPAVLAAVTDHLDLALTGYRAGRPGEESAILLQQELRDRLITQHAIGMLMAEDSLPAAAAAAVLAWRATERGIPLLQAAADLIGRSHSGTPAIRLSPPG